VTKVGVFFANVGVFCLFLRKNRQNMNNIGGLYDYFYYKNTN